MKNYIEKSRMNPFVCHFFFFHFNTFFSITWHLSFVSFHRIDFDNPATTRAGALAKSAVLAALEEEEREKAGQKPGEWTHWYTKTFSLTLSAEKKSICKWTLAWSFLMHSNGMHTFLHNKYLLDSMEYVMCMQCFPCKRGVSTMNTDSCSMLLSRAFQFLS